MRGQCDVQEYERQLWMRLPRWLWSRGRPAELQRYAIVVFSAIEDGMACYYKLTLKLALMLFLM